MDGVGAGLGDGVDLSAGGLTELSRVARGGGFKLLDGVLRENIGSADSAATGLGEEGLLVIGSIDQIGVVKAGDTAVGDETRVAVGNYVGAKENEIIVAAAVDGQICDQFLADGLRYLGLQGVDQRRGVGDCDLGGRGACRQSDIDRENLTDSQDEVLAVYFAEASGGSNDFIAAGLEEGGGEFAGAVGGDGTCGPCIRCSDDDVGAGNDRTGGVGNYTRDSAGSGGLRDSGGDGEDSKDSCQDKGEQTLPVGKKMHGTGLLESKATPIKKVRCAYWVRSISDSGCDVPANHLAAT